MSNVPYYKVKHGGHYSKITQINCFQVTKTNIMESNRHTATIYIQPSLSFCGA